ncbi:dCTP deaminase [Spirulina sp. CCNP1310]|uniref:dCTP deaminase n=1 Tax=Spirulina sp. CCNP1310 TaxID=3110249 RepID=UPI002B1FB1B2|nr:dCTP deaminase [Spirulina sp. CCNP1310]MEA5418764.1 dCTP deaminase [Spirulina sp. CCNP1310]
MIKNDDWIASMAQNGMIEPFEPQQVRQLNEIPCISYGLSSFGYDIRLSASEFRIFRHIPGTIVDPKNFNPKNLEFTQLCEDESGSYFILPAHSYGLGVSLEKLEIPNNVIVICLGKSTYARCGIIANVTPAEAAWRGYLTLELSNSSSTDCKIYASEGVLQLLFLEGEPCKVNYDNRQGKYQNQPARVTLAKI